MNIIVISEYYNPDNFKINEITQELVRQGHTVKVITGLPDYTTSRIPHEYKWLRRRKENLNGVHVIRVPTIARRSGSVMRIINYFSFAFSAFLYCLFCKCDFDVIFVYGLSPITQALPAVVLKKRSKKKMILYVLDIWPEVVKTWNFNEDHIIYKVAHKISRYAYKRADFIPTTSHSFISYLEKVNQVPSEKLRVLPQHGEAAFHEIADQYVDNGTVDFVMAGNIGSAQDIDVIIRAVSKIKRENFKVHIIGDGSKFKDMISLAEKMNVIDRIIFYGRRPFAEMPDFYKLADYFLLTLNGDNEVGKTIPAKFQGYLSAGKPIVAAISGDTHTLINQHQLGLAVLAGDVDGLCDKMMQAIDQYPDFGYMGKNGFNFFKKNYTFEIFIKKLTQILKEQAMKKEGEEQHVSR